MSIPTRNSDRSQVAASNRTFFVTSSIAEKRNLLQSDRAAELFVHFLHEYRAQGKYRLHEFVVMPDHFHVLVTIGAEISIEKAVQFIKGRFAFEAGCRLGFMAPVWQKGFSEVRIVNGDQYDGVAEYIRNNPVVAHLVEKAEDYRYSSAYPGVELDPAPQGLKPCSLSLAVRHG